MHDNNTDRHNKGRDNQPKGEQVKFAKLNNVLVFQLRDIYAAGVSVSRIAKVLGMRSSYVHKIVNRKIWRHAP